jgi:HlyD family secretion protein
LLPAADFPSVDIVLAINGQKELEESTMVTNSKKSLFRKKPLEKAAAPEQLDQPIQIIKLLTWLPLATLGSLVIAAITWSITGRIPITATGQGVLIYPSTIVDVQAFGTGQLLELKIKVGDTVKKGDILATLDQTELKKQLQQMQAKRSLLRVQHEQANALQQQRSKGQQASLAQQILSFQQQLRAAQGMVPVHKNRLKNHQWLKSEGAISGEAVLVVQQAYSESLDKVSTLKAQLQEVNSQQSLFPEESLVRTKSRKLNEILLNSNCNHRSRGKLSVPIVGKFWKSRPLPDKPSVQEHASARSQSKTPTVNSWELPSSPIAKGKSCNQV